MVYMRVELRRDLVKVVLAAQDTFSDFQPISVPLSLSSKYSKDFKLFSSLGRWDFQDIYNLVRVFSCLEFV